MAHGSEKKRPKRPQRNTRVALAIGICVLIIVAAFVFITLSPNTSGRLAIDWRMKLTIHDSRSWMPTFGQNKTPPAGIGVEAGIWVNRTLEKYGPSGFSPISTRDSSGTIYIQSITLTRPDGLPLIFTFGDFFNVWGQRFDETCVLDYCTAPGEPVVQDLNNNGIFDAGEPVVSLGTAPAIGKVLASDPKLKLADNNGNGVLDSGEVLAYDANVNSVYDKGELVIPLSSIPAVGTPLVTDPQIRFDDADSSDAWTPAQPPPVMSDGTIDARCLKRSLNLSNGKDWVIIIGSSLAGTIGGCRPGT